MMRPPVCLHCSPRPSALRARPKRWPSLWACPPQRYSSASARARATRGVLTARAPTGSVPPSFSPSGSPSPLMRPPSSSRAAPISPPWWQRRPCRVPPSRSGAGATTSGHRGRGRSGRSSRRPLSASRLPRARVADLTISLWTRARGSSSAGCPRWSPSNLTFTSPAPALVPIFISTRTLALAFTLALIWPSAGPKGGVQVMEDVASRTRTPTLTLP